MSNMYRFRCNCGQVFNAPEGTANCSKCGAPLMTANCGVVQLYRMGSPIGVAAGMGVYIDNVPYGHIGNTESTRIVLPFGTHTLHMTLGMTRKCKDLQFTITPEQNYFYAKAHIKPGFWSNTVVIEAAKPEEMPQA